MKTLKTKVVLIVVGATLLTFLANGCATAPQVSPGWEWYQMSEHYPYPPAAQPVPLYMPASIY